MNPEKARKACKLRVHNHWLQSFMYTNLKQWTYLIAASRLRITSGSHRYEESERSNAGKMYEMVR